MTRLHVWTWFQHFLMDITLCLHFFLRYLKTYKKPLNHLRVWILWMLLKVLMKRLQVTGVNILQNFRIKGHKRFWNSYYSLREEFMAVRTKQGRNISSFFHRFYMKLSLLKEQTIVSCKDKWCDLLFGEKLCFLKIYATLKYRIKERMEWKNRERNCPSNRME